MMSPLVLLATVIACIQVVTVMFCEICGRWIETSWRWVVKTWRGLHSSACSHLAPLWRTLCRRVPTDDAGSDARAHMRRYAGDQVQYPYPPPSPDCVGQCQARTRYQVEGTRNKVPDTKCQAPDTRYKIAGSRYLPPVTWYQVLARH